MAGQSEEVVTLVRIDTGESVRTIADLKKYVDDLKKGIQKLEIGTEEYNDTLRALQAAQDAQKDAMHYGVETVKAAKGSYNDLVHTMRELKQEWRATNDESKRNDLGKQIDVINTQLKAYDESVGVFSRSVGNYSNKIQEAFVAMGSKAGAAAAGGVKNLKLGFDAISKTPLLAILGLIITVIEKVVAKMKQSEEGTKALSNAFSVLQGASVIVGKVLEKVGEALAWVTDKLVGLMKKLKLYSDEMKVAQDITQDELALEKKRRQTIMDNADAEKKIADLRAKSVEMDKYNLKQREAFLQEALTLEEQKAQREKELAEDEYNLIIKRNSQLKNSEKDLKAEADAYARKVGAETAYLEAKRRTTKEINALRKSQKREERADQRDAEKAAKDDAAALNARLATEKDILSQELELTKKGTAERLAKQLELREKEYEIARAKAEQTVKDKEKLDQQLLLLEQKYNNDVEKTKTDFAREQLDAETQRKRDALEAEILLMEEGSTARLEKELELKQFELDNVHRLEQESDEAFHKRQIETLVAYNEQQKKLVQARLTLYQTWASNVTGLMGGIADAYEAMSDNEEKAAEDTKAVRIAAAVIDTISGAIGAYMSAVLPSSGIPAPYNMILGAIQAATVTATGMANIAKMKSVNVKNGSSASVSAAVSAPPAVQQVPVTRTATSASEEERLDQIASKQRVVLVYSDVQDAAEYVEVVQDETEF